MTTRHYSLIKGFALAAFIPLFAACSSEEDSPLQSGKPQEVQVSISTRASESGDNFTWENSDQLKLYVTPRYGSTTTTTEYTLTYNGSAWSTFNATLPATVEACYPATATLTSFTIPTNQSAGIAEADYMTTASSQQLNGNELSLALVHRLCKVAVTISGYEDYSSTPAVESEVFYSYLTVNYNNDAWTGTGELTSITPFKTESSADGHHTYQAIVAPASSYSPFLTLMVNGKDRTVNCNQALVSGNAYTFNLTVRNSDATTRSADTSDYELELVEVRDLNEE